MIGQWLSWLNCALVGLALLFGLAGGLYWLKRPAEIVCMQALSKTCGLPKGGFELPEVAYQQAGEPLLALQQSPPTLQLPDLRQQLIYYGKNGRPDAQSTHTLLHFSLNGNKTVVSTPPGEKLYLFYDRKMTPGRYNFSPQNEKTSLWIEATPVDNEVQVHVTLENDKGEKIVEPEAFAQFRLPEKEFIRYAGTNWEIGGFRVDGTLLARQRARWYGPDRFLERHGGEEFKHSIGKQRIDFGENDDLYSVFVKSGDCLIWNQNRWKVVSPGEESLGHPLLVVKKIDERLMTFELWDVEGKGKILLNLLKSTEPWAVQNAQTLQHMFKFVGARTRTQCVFEINRERMILRPSDWLLLTPKGWKKLATEEEIDQYVKRKLSGTLFVFEGITRKDERQMMVGMLYSPARNDCQAVELALKPKGSKPTGSKDSKEGKETKDAKEGAEAGDSRAPIARESEMRHPMIPAPTLPPK
jgi:hypothetical protein